MAQPLFSAMYHLDGDPSLKSERISEGEGEGEGETGLFLLCLRQ